MVILISALALGMAGGVISRYFFREHDQTEEILNLILDMAQVEHKLKTLESDLEDLSGETGFLITRVAAELEDLMLRVDSLEERIATLPTGTQPERQPTQAPEETEPEPPSFEVLDFHVETKDSGVLVFITIRNTADVVATFTPFVRCNKGPKYLWHQSAGSLYLAPGEQDQISYDPYRRLELGSYTFTLTYVWIEAISEEGEHIASWKVPLEGYVDTLEVRSEQETHG